MENPPKWKRGRFGGTQKQKKRSIPKSLEEEEAEKVNDGPLEKGVHTNWLLRVKGCTLKIVDPCVPRNNVSSSCCRGKKKFVKPQKKMKLRDASGYCQKKKNQQRKLTP